MRPDCLDLFFLTGKKIAMHQWCSVEVFPTKVWVNWFLISVLDDNLLPVIARHFSNRRWIFQENNASFHVSARANKWKLENDINTLPWPVQSCDLNILENVWKMLKLSVKRRLNEIPIPMTKNKLYEIFRVPSLYTKYKVCMQVCWGEFDRHYEPASIEELR